MLDFVIIVLKNFWFLAVEMAPYLFLGFFVAGLLNELVPAEFIARHIGSNSPGAVLKSSIMGIPLPLCSCGVLPVATSLRKTGAGKAPTIAFLITTPVTGVDSIMATYAFLGGIFTIIRVAVSFVIGLTAGLITSLVSKGETKDNDNISQTKPKEKRSFIETVKSILVYAFWELPITISGSVLAGLAIGAIITSFLPDSFVQTHIGTGFLGVLVAISVAIPLYVCATGSIPIAVAMIMKGFSPGAALAFLIAGPATNMVAITTVKKLLGTKIVLIYLSTIFIGSLGFGFLLDQIIVNYNLPILSSVTSHAGMHHSLFSLISGGMLLMLFGGLYLFSIPLISSLFHKKRGEEMPNEIKLSVPDMTCNHCKRNVGNILDSYEGVSSYEIDLNRKIVLLTHEDSVNIDGVQESLEKGGYGSKKVD
jgi:uncharacterized protein